MSILFRTDGGQTIGGGHVMRCLALAQAWREQGGRATFASVTLAPALRQRLVDDGFPIIEVAAPVGSEADAETTLRIAGAHGCGIAVIDGYHFQHEFHHHLKTGGLRVATIDDNGEIGRYVDDLVINQGMQAAAELYDRRAPYTRLLLGTRYVLLRREFRTWADGPRDTVTAARRMLVTLGAADPENVTQRVIDAIAPSIGRGIETTVLVGGSNPHAAAIAERLAGLTHFRLLQDQHESVPALMAAADLAICAGGSTVWELAFMGVPFLPIVVAENQRRAVEALADSGYPMLAAAEIEQRLASEVTQFAGDPARRSALSILGKRLVDGQGCMRVCAALTDLRG